MNTVGVTTQNAPTFAGALNTSSQFARFTYLSSAFLMTSETVSLRSVAASSAAAQTSSGTLTERKGLDAIVNFVHFVNEQLIGGGFRVAVKAFVDVTHPRFAGSDVIESHDVATTITIVFHHSDFLAVKDQVSSPSDSAIGLHLCRGVHFVLHWVFLSLGCIYRLRPTVYTSQVLSENTFGRVA